MKPSSLNLQQCFTRPCYPYRKFIRLPRHQIHRKIHSTTIISTSQAQPPSDKRSESPIRVSTLFTALLCLGVGTTVFGLYDIYSTMTMWPKEIRTELRAALTSKNQGKLDVSERYFQRALTTAKSLPIETLSPEPYLKLSGIAVGLAEAQEALDVPQKAYETYADILSLMQASLSQLTGAERMRAVTIASKLGEMVETYQLSPEEEEKWLTWAVNEVLRIAKEQKGSSSSDTELVMIAELELPKWISNTDIGGPLSALGAFYSRTGKLEYAMPLYLHAISMLIPPPSSGKVTPPEDHCKGAQLMTSLSELIVRDQPSPERLHQSEAWAKQALGILEKIINSGQQISICDEALVFAYFNLASLREMAGDVSSSKKLYEASLQQSTKIGMKEGVYEAQRALRRRDREDRAAVRANPLKDDSNTE